MTADERWFSALPTQQDIVDMLAAKANATAIRSLREWCDKTQAAASGDQSEPVFQARMQLVDEVRALLPEVPPAASEDP